MIQLQKGQRSKLVDIGLTNNFAVAITIPCSMGEVDVSCFGLDSSDKLSDDRYMIFYNQLSSPDKSISATIINGLTTFSVQLDKLDTKIKKLVFTASVPDSISIRNVGDSSVIFGDSCAQISFTGSTFDKEKAVILAEIYLKDDLWRLSSFLQGFDSGLSGLLKHFGGEETKPVTPAPRPAPAPVSLQKVTGKVQLTKNSKPVVIAKTPELTTSISWESGTDYDVYALVLMRDGTQHDVATFGAQGVSALTNFGNGAVVHMGDTGRGGGHTKTEIIKIKLNDNIAAVLPVAYSAQSNGTGSFRRYKVSMTIDNNSGTDVTISAENANNNDNIFTCVPGLILNLPDGVVIEPLEYYSRPGSEHRPKLTKNHEGKIVVQMDQGPVNDYK